MNGKVPNFGPSGMKNIVVIVVFQILISVIIVVRSLICRSGNRPVNELNRSLLRIGGYHA